MMHGHEKSRSAIVAVKPTNKAERSAAEPVEPRAEAEGNAGQQITHRAQYRLRVAQALARIRRLIAVDTRGGNRMRESCTYGSVRGVPSNGRPYRDRREFIALLGGAAVPWPLAARAQQPAMPVVGFLISGSLGGYQNLLIAFRKGLAELDYVESRTVRIEYRGADGRFDRLPALAADLIQRGAAVIVAGGSALGARKASATIPLVFLAGDDPVKFGLVASLNRPGGTATGVAWLTSELFTKRLEFVRELVPGAAVIGVLINPNSPEIAPQLKEIETAARAIGQEIQIVNASIESDFDTAFANLAGRRAGALIVTNDSFFMSMRERVVAFATQYRIPTIYDRREYAVAGGLMCYGTSYSAAYRELGIYTGKILKGTKPADLPIAQAVKFEFVINLKTAKALGLQIPDKLLALADEVIE